ncbi:MAG: hypothetical protein ACRDJ9_07245 [Dehalococcoidia bacterium]
MAQADETIGVISALVDGFRDVLGSRLAALVAYGSAVTGDFIAGFSDFDFVAFVASGLEIADCLELQRRLASVDPYPFAYLQMHEPVDLSDEAGRRPILTPGSFRAVYGAVSDERFLHDENSLRAAGRAWLADLPRLIRQDTRDWAVAVGGARTRLLRLLMTRLKPALRGLLVEQGEPVLQTWAAPYAALAERWALIAPEYGAQLKWLLELLPPSPEVETRCGEAMIRILLAADQQARGVWSQR